MYKFWLKIKKKIKKTPMILAVYNFFRNKSVDFDKILIGQQNGYPLEDWVEKSHEYSRISVLIKDSPYVDFLLKIDKNPKKLDDDFFLKETKYFKMAQTSIKYHGSFFEAAKEDEIFEIMRRFYEMYLNFKENIDESSENMVKERSGRTRSNSSILLNRINFSDCYEIVDGHHRAAIKYTMGCKNIKARVIGRKNTYLQNLLLDYSQTTKTPELYQPIDKAEVKDWRLVRLCTDRLKMIDDFLKKKNLYEKNKSLLDISCSYGWFLKKFKEKGLMVLGVDKDVNAVKIGKILYDFNDNEIIQGNALSFIDESIKNNVSFDMVLFLSILHHFAIGKEKGEADKILNRLDKITKKILILDTGQNHEEWNFKRLAEWNDDYIEKKIRENTSFKEIYKLGKDEDNRGKYKKQYQRTLFACVK